MTITHLGLLAGTITTAAAIPQVVRTYRTRHARDISIWQPVLLNVGMSLWLVYGIALGDIPLICANAVSLVCYTALIVMKILFRNDDKRSGCDTIQSS
ncbi:MAG TPA: SemiSWEET transporter [Geobacteraceae bacterium]|nr:SemiSWEET transporter [Geobacteraceae bacterium]